MKTTIKITLLSLLTPLFIGAMQQPEPAALSSQAQQPATTSNWPDSNASRPLNLPADIVRNHIIPNTGTTLAEIGNSVRSLCSIKNRSLYTFLNDNDVIIPQIARQKNAYEWETALALRTVGARNWLRRRFTCENEDLNSYFDSYVSPALAIDQDPDQETSKRIRFLIHCFPMIAELGDWPPLTYPTHIRNMDRIRNLIESGMNINHASKRGITPLMRACQSKNVEIVRALLAAGADVSIRRPNGQDAFDFANGGTPMLNPMLNFAVPQNNGGALAINLNDIIADPSEQPARVQILQLLEEAKQRQDEQKRGCSVQ